MARIFTVPFNIMMGLGIIMLFWEINWWWATLACLPLIFVGSKYSTRRFAYKNNELRLIVEAVSYIIAVLGIIYWPYESWPAWLAWVLVMLGCVVMLPILALMAFARLRGGRIKV